MTDLELVAIFLMSIAAIAVPIVVIVILLDMSGISDLFTLPSGPQTETRPPEEDPTPRWRVELLNPRPGAGGDVAPSRQPSGPPDPSTSTASKSRSASSPSPSLTRGIAADDYP